MDKIFLAFGDSIVWGASDSEKGGWVERFKVFMSENYDTGVYNLGVSGEKTPNLLKRNESKTTPIPWDTDKSYKNENIQRNNEIIKTARQKNDLSFIEVFNRLDKEDLYAGLHPDAEGHQKIFEIVRDFLIENKIVGR